MKRILILYPYYWPFYKAGGPVQSLYNFIQYFKEKAVYYLFSLNRDIDGSKSESVIQERKWVQGPFGEHIYYQSSFSFLSVYNSIKKLSPDVIYINGLYNASLALPALVYARMHSCSIIVAPRGMLQCWGLKRNSKIKRLYNKLFDMLLRQNALWHATDQQEVRDIQFNFGKEKRVHVAANIPKPIASFRNEGEASKKIKLMFLSLINRNKNLHVVVEAVNILPDFELHIYGPVIDRVYWEDCLIKIMAQDRIKYKGAVVPWEVQDLMSRYDYFVLPTNGENFGHAIFDALSVGLPVIVTRNTPWFNLDIERAGFYIDAHHDLLTLLKKIASLKKDEHTVYRQKSLIYAKQFWDKQNYEQDYGFVFN